MPTVPDNLLTDVAGIAVGHAQDDRIATGVTAIVLDPGTVVSVSVLGGAPGTRETDALAPENTVETVDAILLGGGSAFGLDAASGAQAWLREAGRGFAVAHMRIPIVAQAICFDLLNGGDKNWGRFPPYRELGYQACAAATAGRFALGTAGGGYGATTADLKGGIGSASATSTGGHTVGAIAVVNAIGSAVVGGGPHFWAAGLERNREFGGLGFPPQVTPGASELIWKGRPVQPATTIALVATDASLSKAQARRLAIAAHAGLARALRLSHAPMDGDTVFAASTGRRPSGGPADFTELCALAADCLSRAIARGVYEATALPFPGALPAWRDHWG